MKSTILTDTPEKEKLREEQEISNRKKEAKNLKLKKRNFLESNTKNKNKKKSKPKTIVASSDEEDDYFCIVCLGAYSKSRKVQDWIECTSCKKWAHEKCAGKQNVLFYNCKHCTSDIDED
ncbi:PHD finger protein ALFIN-LIKE 6-like [Myzus persicae]|nr:PHD finger protein ALFIN-LIKE 6-like [Myzus persicae]